MIKLKDVKVKGVCHANVFTHNDIKRLGTLEGMDIILYLSYNVDKELSQLENYRLSEYELNDLEDALACYMSVFLEDDLYKRLDETSHEYLDYRILSDVCSGVEAVEQEFSDEQQKIAFEMIKQYVTTEQFKRELDAELKL